MKTYTLVNGPFDGKVVEIDTYAWVGIKAVGPYRYLCKYINIFESNVLILQSMVLEMTISEGQMRLTHTTVWAKSDEHQELETDYDILMDHVRDCHTHLNRAVEAIERKKNQEEVITNIKNVLNIDLS